MFGVSEVECTFVDACGLQNVNISAEKGEGHRTGGIDAGILELAVDEQGDGDEPARGGLGEVAGPLVDTDGADDLLGLSDLVHLGEGSRGRKRCDAEECA